MDEPGGAHDGKSLAAGRAIGRRRGDRIVGASRSLQEVVEKALAAASSHLPVWLTGPEGSGKEHVARAIHSWGPRASGPLAVVSCIGVPEALRAREIFGCGESTYASLPQAHEGALERAARGTLLIDHVDALSSDVTQALAKAISGGRFQREGDATSRSLTARVVLVSREPLSPSPFHELVQHQIALPSLAERPEDVLPLAAHFLGELCREAGITPVGFTSDARSALCAEPWPGNVRELGERIAQALRLSGTGAITAEALLLAAPPEDVPSFKDAKRAFERRYVTGLLRRCDGNISRAARLAKKDRKDFYDVIRRTGVDPTEFR